MSANCTKDFSITIADTTLVAYWKFDEAAGTTRADSTVNGNDISTLIGSISAVAGKISNAMRIPALDVDPAGPAIGTLSWTPVWNGESITIAGWLRNAAGFANETQFYFLGNVGAGWRFGIDTVTNSEFQCFLIDELANNTTVIPAVSSVQDVYYFVVIQLDVTALTIGISVNDSVIATAAIPRVPGIPVTNEFTARNQSVSTQRDFDEFGVWYRKLTVAERTALYNGGAGNTYPNVPSGP